MRIWSIQPEALFEKLKVEKALHCDPAQSELLNDRNFRSAYDWLARQMAIRVAPPPKGARYPFWAWHTIEWKHQKPDLRRIEFRAYKGNQVCLELDIPDDMVLLSNEDSWHIVLNHGYYGNYSNEQEIEQEDAWLNNLPPEEQTIAKMKSWDRIFNISPPYEGEWECRGKYVQATFWELRLDQVIAVRHFRGRLASFNELEGGY